MTQPAQHATPTPTADAQPSVVEALHDSVERLHLLVAGMSDPDLTARAYPTQWTVAQVLSHLGSGAVITQRRLQDTLAGQDTPEQFAPGVWDAWNAKSPTAQRYDCMAADEALLASIEAVSHDQRDRFSSAMGPITMGFQQFVAMRLNEHAFHTWDIEVVGDPAASIPVSAAAHVVDNLEIIARYTAKPTGDTATITVVTSHVRRGFTIDLAATGVTLTPGPAAPTADIELPAEAFARLVYGRLDPAHTPPSSHGAALDTLRQVFPGP